VKGTLSDTSQHCDIQRKRERESEKEGKEREAASLGMTFRYGLAVIVVGWTWPSALPGSTRRMALVPSALKWVDTGY